MANTFNKKIQVAVDGSPQSDKAFALAVQLARDTGGEISIVHAIPDTRTGVLAEYGTRHGGMAIVKAYFDSAKKAALQWMEPLEKRAREQEVNAKGELLWETGKSAVQLITEYAKRNDVGLIVMGTRGRGGFKRLLLGSVAAGVVSHAPCSVMVVR